MSVVQQAAGEPRASISSSAWPAARWAVVAGLAMGVVLGMSGNFFKPGAVQNFLYALSSMGLVAAVPVLAIRQARAGRMLPAAGFIVLAVAEMLIWTGGPGSLASFAAGVMFYVPALLLISLPSGLPPAARIIGAVAALPWAIFAGAYLIDPKAAPILALQIVGYLLFSAAAVSWLVVAVRDREWGS